VASRYWRHRHSEGFTLLLSLDGQPPAALQKAAPRIRSCALGYVSVRGRRRRIMSQKSMQECTERRSPRNGSFFHMASGRGVIPHLAAPEARAVPVMIRLMSALFLCPSGRRPRPDVVPEGAVNFASSDSFSNPSSVLHLYHRVLVRFTPMEAVLHAS